MNSKELDDPVEDGRDGPGSPDDLKLLTVTDEPQVALGLDHDGILVQRPHLPRAGGELDALADSLSEGGQRIAVLALRLPLKTYQYVTWVNAGNRAQSYGHDLYSNLRALDKAGCARILVQEVPGDERWDAIRARLARAAVGAAVDSGRFAALGTGVLP